MSFVTKIDYSNNRQVRQTKFTTTALSGTTTFGLPYSALTSGVDTNTIVPTSSLSAITSTFSGDGITTSITFGDPRMIVAAPSLVSITPLNSGTTQNASGYEGKDFIEVDGNIVFLNYTGSTYDFTTTSMVEVSIGQYTGETISNNVFFYSGGSLDFSGRTIWVDVPGIITAKRIELSERLTVSGNTYANSFIAYGGTNDDILLGDGSTTSLLGISTSGDYLPLSGGTLTGDLTGTTFIISGGTSSDFLKADGSLDSNTYLTSETDSQTLSFSAGTGNLGISNGNIINLDNRYSLTGHTHNEYLTGFTSVASATTFNPYLTLSSTDVQSAVEELKDEVDALVVSGGTGATSLSGLTDIDVSGTTSGDILISDGSLYTNRQLLESDISDFGTYLSSETNDYVNSASFNVTDGVLTLNMLSGGTVTVDLDDRYSLTGHTHNEYLTGFTSVASATTFNPYLTLSSTDVQSVIEELKDEVDTLTLTGGTGATSLSGLTDVDVSGTTSGDILISNGSLYTNRLLLESDISDFGTYTNNLGTVTSVGTNAPLTGTITGSGNLSITQATTSTDGYLSQTDWNVFNNKTSNTGTVTSVGTGTGLDGTITGAGTITLDFSELPLGGTLLSTDWLIANNATVESRQVISSIPLSIFNNNNNWTSNAGTVTNVGTNAPLTGTITGSGNLSITQATTSTDGYLSQTDWDTFNNKTSNAGTVTNVNNGNGMSFTNFTTSGAVTLGTPSTLNATSTNAVTTSSHTHAITGFLPLTGGSMSGNIQFGETVQLKLASRANLYGTPGAVVLDLLSDDFTIRNNGTMITTISRVSGDIFASSFTASGGTSSQFLKADGSIDSTVYTNNVGDITEVIAGDGTTGGSTGGSAILTLGTPSTLNATSTNAVTTTSHTHAITGFLRNNASDVYTSGTLTFNDNTIIGFGTSNGEGSMWSNGVDLFIDVSSTTGKDLFIRDGTVTRYSFLTDTGDLTATGDMTAVDFNLSSDERLKKNIKNLIPKPIKTNWKQWDWIDTKESDIGLIAQDVEKTHPEFVKTDIRTGMKSVSYIKVLVAKMVEKDDEIESLKNRLDKLEFIIKTLL